MLQITSNMIEFARLLERLAEQGEQIIREAKEEQEQIARRQLEEENAIRLAQWQVLQSVIASTLQELNPTSSTECDPKFRKDDREFFLEIHPFGIPVQAQFSYIVRWALERFIIPKSPRLVEFNPMRATTEAYEHTTSLPVALALARRLAREVEDRS
ncbi:hypothetical protein [Tuwongella immobilis]|uniref:Uncharacterized protein n=1 Tax=Tuwongella immobilis TaxID=692036 RepID=A0A6C2YQC8_9BACT|nr:hypothetical protein [Tuwongella immobilis]VIP03092.1 unnamed protein product [Tuwongella immobilis]VTS03363.1 unnamed protein product [Tuwongella immobilis]